MAIILKKLTCIFMFLALLFSCLNEIADCFSTTSSRCNGTADHCSAAADDEAEFLMDQSEIIRRVLASQPMISYDSLNPNKGYCDASVYGSCIGPESKIYNDRPCDYQNLCARET